MAFQIAQALMLCLSFIIPSYGQGSCSLIQKSAWVDNLDEKHQSQDMGTDKDLHAPNMGTQLTRLLQHDPRDAQAAAVAADQAAEAAGGDLQAAQKVAQELAKAEAIAKTQAEELAAKAAAAKEAAKNAAEGEQETAQAKAEEATEEAKKAATTARDATRAAHEAALAAEKAGQEAARAKETAERMAQQYTKAMGNYALVFDGVDDKVQLPWISGVLSLTMWVNIDVSEDSDADLAYLLDARSGRTNAYVSNKGIGTGPAGFQDFKVDGKTKAQEWDSIPRDGNWHHIYLQPSGTYDGSLTLASNYQTTGGKSGITDGLKVQIDELGLWNDTFGESQLRDMIAYVNPNPDNLLAYYNFNDGPGSKVLTDVTNNSHHGDLINMDRRSAWVDGKGTPASLGLDPSLVYKVS
eukprot:CAMPEP_0170618990 /NCGR_PEP_ID=MMETSP0224-20130122/27268_1 /TAXON_ID=285029 /ORGANISM="Togula jolla, Strain CCCM 725" /LENGTH=408 /DNA_ID=CAMNT_0010945031 /DNA_START=85 /DNA_END=1311 /DNA_ORIENTATION=-